MCLFVLLFFFRPLRKFFIAFLAVKHSDELHRMAGV